MTVNVTHPDKIFWPKERYSKGDMLAYYDKIAPYLLPYLKDRAESLNRFPDDQRQPFLSKGRRSHAIASIRQMRIPARQERRKDRALCRVQ
jgi:DNA primase